MRHASVLVVDKDPRFLEKTAEILASASFDMLSARDALEARDLVVHKRPDVVFVSARLRGDEGYELCRFVKAHERVTPVVLVFSREERDTTRVQLDTEADNYIVRPLKRGELLACVRDMLRIRRLQEESERFRTELAQFRAREQKKTDISPDIFFPFDLFKKVVFIELKRAQRHHLPLTALLLSLDGTDALLAAYGPQTMARLRDGVARAIRRSIRDTDLPVSLRLGSLLVLMPHTEAEGARVVAERIQQRIRRSAFRHEGVLLRPTLSMGSATKAPEADASFSEMITTASMALRDAQRQGGDRFVLS